MSQVVDMLSPQRRMARVVADMSDRVKHLTSEQKRVARHLAREGKTIEQIRQSLGVNMHRNTLVRRLREINILTNRAYARHIHD